MPQLGNFLGLTSLPILGSSAPQELTIPVATTEQVIPLGFSVANMGSRFGTTYKQETYTFSIPGTPLIKQYSTYYGSLGRANNLPIISSSDTYPFMELSYVAPTWTLSYDFFNSDTENYVQFLWTASGTADKIPVTGWTGGLNNATGEIQIADPNSFDFYHTMLDSNVFKNAGGGGAVRQSWNATEYMENCFVYTSQTPATLSSLFNTNFLKQSTFISAADVIDVYSNTNVVGTTFRNYRAYYGSGLWRIANNALPSPPASTSDYPIVNGNCVFFRRNTSGSGSDLRYMPLIDGQRVFKRALLLATLSQATYVVTDPLQLWSGTYVPSASSDGALVGSGIWHITGTTKYLIQAGFVAGAGGTSPNWRFFNSSSGSSFTHFSTDSTSLPRNGWRNVIASTVVVSNVGTEYGRQDIFIT
jgi:hypothetical protein